MGFWRGSWREERDAFFLYFSMPTGGRQGNVEAKSGHPFFLKKSIRRGGEGEKSLRESPHTRGLQHPHHPCLTSSLTSRIEREKKAAAAGPRFLLFFPSARRAAPHRAWDDLLAWRPPPFREEIKRGVGGRRRAFLPAALRPARRPPAPLPPRHGRVDGTHTLLQGCHLGCHDAGWLPGPLLLPSRLGVQWDDRGCMSGRLVCPLETGNRGGGSIVPDHYDEAWWVHRSSGYHLSLLMVTTEQYSGSGHGILFHSWV